jgi:hypothetical protein
MRVSAPPRPVMVTPKKPLVRRLWFRALVVTFLVGAVATGGFFAWQERRAAAELEAAREDVARLGVEIEAAVLGVGQPMPTGEYAILPEMGQTLAEIGSGEFRPRRILRQVEEWEGALEDTEAALAAIETDQAGGRQALARMREGLGLYAGVVSSIPDALEETRDARRQEALVGLQTRALEGAETFSSGWQIYVTLRAEVGLDAVPGGMDPGQLPPDFDPTQLPPGFDPTQLPEGFDPTQLPEGEVEAPPGPAEEE